MAESAEYPVCLGQEIVDVGFDDARTDRTGADPAFRTSADAPVRIAPTLAIPYFRVELGP